MQMGINPICWGPEWNKKVEESWVCSLSKLGHPSLLPWDIGTPGSWAFGARLFIPLTHRFSGLQVWSKATPPAFLIFQLTGGRSWDFSASITAWTNPLCLYLSIHLPVYIDLNRHKYTYIFCFLWSTLTNTDVEVTVECGGGHEGMPPRSCFKAELFAPATRSAISRQPPDVSLFRVCLSCREPPHPRSCPS